MLLWFLNSLSWKEFIHALFVYIPTSSLLLSFEQEAASDVLWNPTPTLQRSLVFLGQIYIFE